MTNVVVLRGRTSRAPRELDLPSGDRLTTLDVTVTGTGEESGRRADSVPLSWLDAPGWVGGLEPGSELVVVGRVRRRFFRSGNALQSRTEVVVDHGAQARHPARCAIVLRRALAALDADPALVTPVRMAARSDGV